jgi:hypothetical protein
MIREEGRRAMVVIDREAWLAAKALVEQHGDEAMAYVTAKLLVLRSEKDEIGEQAWTLIAEAVKELQSTDPKGPLN